ncbi:hypothetical protein [Armatimonas rosea]|uniref:Membrane protein YfhO n=1 Tax=Armatimonas rosea TaxID=685828 RepID=A0A7W9SMI6_ARMRO|nr:hypothetical protein [Armatimonas rosea]MBB6048683.1 hypothetical protein [Armatimonas rosea]
MKPHSLRQKLLLLVSFVLVFLAIRVQIITDDGEGTLSVDLNITGLSPQEDPQVQVFALSALGEATPLAHLDGTTRWRQAFLYKTQTLRIYLPPAVLQKKLPLTVTCAGRVLLETDTATLATTWTPVPKPTGHPSPLVALDSPPRLRGTFGTLNGPELTPYGEVGAQALALLGVGFGLVWLSEWLAPRLQRPLRILHLCLRQRPARAYPTATERVYRLGGLACLGGSLVLLVHGKRYGFVHDDNITQFLPVILQGCESLFRGIFPTYNPFELMGSPTASVGTYALTYPPTYLCYAVARWLFHDTYLTLDLFEVLHLALGYLATFSLARRLGLRPALALCVALSFVLCGYFVVYTRCWFYMGPVALWTPLLLLALLPLTDPKPLTVGWPLRTGLVLGLYFHAGNAQMWIYTLLCAACLLLLWQRTGQLVRGRLCWIVAALLVGLAIAAPLLIVQSMEVVGIRRSANIKAGVLPGLFAMLLPTPLVKVAMPGMWMTTGPWKHLANFSPLYFCGPFLLGTAFLGLLSPSWFCWSRRLVGANVWLLCGALALAICLGECGGISQLLVLLPVFNKFQHSWKFLPLVALFCGLGGALMIERWLRLQRHPQTHERLLTILTPALLAYNAFVSQPVLTLPDAPYAPLPESVRALVLDPRVPLQRSMALAPWLPEWRDPGLVAGLSQNFATVYGVPMLEGYDPLVAKSPLNVRLADRLYANTAAPRARQDFDPTPLVEPLTALRRYGVRWALLTEGYKEIKGIYALEKALKDNGRLHKATRHTQVRELSGYDPLAFVEGAPERALPIALTAEGVRVTLGGSAAGTLTVNFLAREQLHAYVDGKRVPSTKDSWDRVRVAVPTGAQALTLRYEPAWGKGFLVSGILLLMALGAMYAATKIADSPD